MHAKTPSLSVHRCRVRVSLASCVTAFVSAVLTHRRQWPLHADKAAESSEFPVIFSLHVNKKLCCHMQTDRARPCVCRNFANCCTTVATGLPLPTGFSIKYIHSFVHSYKLFKKYRRNQSNGVGELKGYSRPTCNKPCASNNYASICRRCDRQARPSTSFVAKLSKSRVWVRLQSTG